ncbi:MAG: TlpA family protein disulfide reductase, partial [Flavobacteriaceae bacterium]
YYKMKPADFSQKIGELRTEKINALARLAQESVLSDQALKIANATIDYTYYGLKEQYPFRHKKALRSHSMPQLPPSFYEYRNHLGYNDKDLAYLRPYYDFMRYHIGNLSYAGCVHKCPGAQTAATKDHLHFNRHKLRLIDSLVKEKELKDNLFRNVAFDYLLKARDKEENNKAFIEEFHRVSGNNKHIGEINELYQGISNLQPQKQLPDVTVTRMDGTSVSIRDIAQDGKTVFYFWSGTNRNHLDHIAKQVKKLQAKKPKHTFVGINIQTEEATWRKLVNAHGLDTTLQYRAQDFHKLTKSLIVYPMNKCIITEDAQIVDAFSDIYKGL